MPWQVTLPPVVRARQRFSSDSRALPGLERLRMVVLPCGQRKVPRRCQRRAKTASPEGATQLFGGVRRRIDAERRISEAKAHSTWVKDKDAASGVSDRPERGKRCRPGH
jgi:hypothetical protein